MRLLKQITEQGRKVNPSAGSTYTPKVFSHQARSEGISKHGFRAAMESLLAEGVIRVSEEGPPSKRRSLAKTEFKAHGAGADGSVVFRRKLSRAQLLKFLAAQPPCVVAMEACASPHRRRRDYLADHDCRVVLRLIDGEGPNLDQVAASLERPVRPLFIGRKPCLPAAPLVAGWVQAGSVPEALRSIGLSGRALWPLTGDEPGGSDLADLRNWQSGLHGGSRRVVEGVIP